MPLRGVILEIEFLPVGTWPEGPAVSLEPGKPERFHAPSARTEAEAVKQFDDSTTQCYRVVKVIDCN